MTPTSGTGESIGLGSLDDCSARMAVRDARPGQDELLALRGRSAGKGGKAAPIFNNVFG
jgi:hypothetical protein